MTKYRVSFEVEPATSSDSWKSAFPSCQLKSLRAFLSNGNSEYVTIPVSAEIEVLPEPEPPFEAGYYGAYLNDELCWVKQFNSAEDLEWSKSYMLPEQEIKPVDIIAKNASAAVKSAYVSTLEGFSVGDFVHVAGHKNNRGSVGIVEEIDTLHKTRPVKVRLKGFGLFQYAPTQLEHITSIQYAEWPKA